MKTKELSPLATWEEMKGKEFDELAHAFQESKGREESYNEGLWDGIKLVKEYYKIK